jgi:hypothetical protein
MTTDSPKVATIWNAGSTPMTRSKMTRCNRYPTTNASGSTTSSATSGLMSTVVLIDSVTKAARMAMSPWARLTKRMTPKANDSPVANSA